MIRKSILGPCLLCALAVGAMAAQSASAAPIGTTVFTCKKKAVKGGAGFSKAHCKTADAVSSEAEYEHVAVAENTTTTATGTTTNTNSEPVLSLLHSVQAGIFEELRSKLAHILPEVNNEKSWVWNKQDATTGEHFIEGEAWIRFTEVSVGAPAEKGCKVKGGEVATNRLKFTSKGQEEGKEMFLKFEPVAAAAGVFAKFEVEGCSVGALNGPYEVKGSVKAQADGTTITTMSGLAPPGVTGQGTLTVRGQKAGFESTFTVEATDPVTDAVDTPLSVTTVSTP